MLFLFYVSMHIYSSITPPEYFPYSILGGGWFPRMKGSFPALSSAVEWGTWGYDVSPGIPIAIAIPGHRICAIHQADCCIFHPLQFPKHFICCMFPPRPPPTAIHCIGWAVVPYGPSFEVAGPPEGRRCPITAPRPPPSYYPSNPGGGWSIGHTRPGLCSGVGGGAPGCFCTLPTCGGFRGKRAVR